MMKKGITIPAAVQNLLAAVFKQYNPQWTWRFVAIAIITFTLAPNYVETKITTAYLEPPVISLPTGQDMIERNPHTPVPQSSPERTPIALYILPMLGTSIGWILWTVCLYTGILLLGGRTTFEKVMQIVIWAWIPFAIRGAIQAVYISINQQPIANPGLSGLIETSLMMPTGLLLWRHVLSQTDIYTLAVLIWLAIGTMQIGRIPIKKAALLVGFTGLLLFIISAIPSLAGQFTENMITNGSFGG
jgi:hypothetical protein